MIYSGTYSEFFIYIQCCLALPYLITTCPGYCLLIDKVSLFANLSPGKAGNKTVMYHLTMRQVVTKISYSIYLRHNHIYVTMPTIMSSAQTGCKVQSVRQFCLPTFVLKRDYYHYEVKGLTSSLNLRMLNHVETVVLCKILYYLSNMDMTNTKYP